MTDQSMREEFEAWALRELKQDAAKWRHPNGEYVYLESEWQAWQAATRQALERAAKVCESVNSHDNPMTAQDCADAIRAMEG